MDYTAEFNRVWLQYPRKVAKYQAHKMWCRMTPEQQQAALEAIPRHLALWQACETEPQFIPHLATWLHQQRWTDEFEIPQPKARIAPGWWATESGTLQQGRSMGLEPRPGETIEQYRERIRAGMSRREMA